MLFIIMMMLVVMMRRDPAFYELGEHGERVPGRSRTWKDILQRAKSIACALKAQGVEPGDSVLLAFPLGNFVDFVDAFFGCVLAKAVAVPCPPLPRAETATEMMPNRSLQMWSRGFHIAGIVAPAAALVVEETLHIKASLEQCSAAAASAANSADNAGWLAALALIDIGKLEGMKFSLKDAEMLKGATPNDPVLWQFTSGSIGAPKGVRLTHTNIIRNMENICKSMSLDQFDHLRIVGWLPLFHDMGFHSQIMLPLRGATTVWAMSPQTFVVNPCAWLKAIHRERAQLAGGPNFATSYARVQ